LNEIKAFYYINLFQTFGGEDTMIPLLFTLGLCALTELAPVGEIPLDTRMPQEENVCIQQLSNGVKTYIRESAFSSQAGAFRIVLRTPSRQAAQYSYEGTLDSLDRVEHFFVCCKEGMQRDVRSNGSSLTPYYFSCSDLPSLNAESPSEMAVIAVGDFRAGDVKDLIEKHFADVAFTQKTPACETSSAIQIGHDEALSKVALSVSYPSIRSSMGTYGDLKESWKLLLLQELFQQRMELCSRGLDEIWVHPHPRFFYPVDGYALTAEERSENLLSLLLWQVEVIRSEGFSEEEFYQAKRKLLNQLQYLSFNVSEPSDAFLASYYGDQFLLGDACLCSQYFFEASFAIVQSAQLSDLTACLDEFLFDDNRKIRVTYPQREYPEILTRDQIEKMIMRVASLASFYQESEIADDSELDLEIKGASSSQDSAEFIQLMLSDAPVFRLANNGEGTAAEDSTASFHQLPLTDNEKRFIRIIVSTMAEKNILQLAFEKRTLHRKGNKIHHVHPLRFMGYILSCSDLKSHLRTIKKSSFKWDALIGGFSKRMREELSNDNVYQHVSGFAQQVGSSKDRVSPYIHKRDFEGLIRSLL
jgi:hypothetical protein